MQKGGEAARISGAICGYPERERLQTMAGSTGTRVGSTASCAAEGRWQLTWAGTEQGPPGHPEAWSMLPGRSGPPRGNLSPSVGLGRDRHSVPS